MEKENRLRDHHLIERANDLKMEQMQEIKKLNQHIIQVPDDKVFHSRDFLEVLVKMHVVDPGLLPNEIPWNLSKYF